MPRERKKTAEHVVGCKIIRKVTRHPSEGLLRAGLITRTRTKNRATPTQGCALYNRTDPAVRLGDVMARGLFCKQCFFVAEGGI